MILSGVMMLYISVAIILANSMVSVVLFATQQSEEAEKWVGPIMTSVVNLAATVFAYLTSRDRLKYDSSHTIKDIRIKELEDDRKIGDAEISRFRKRVNRLARNLMASQSAKPLPFPDELGLWHDDNSSGPDVQ